MADGMHQLSQAKVQSIKERLQFGWRRQLPLFLQTEATECGLACLAMIAAFHGHDVDLAGMRKRFPTSLKGVTLKRVVSMAATLRIACRPLRLEPMHLGQLKTPCMLHWDLNHFVVLRKVTRTGFMIHDPAQGVRHLSRKEMSDHFTGVALELHPEPDLSPVTERQAISLRALTGRVRGVMPALLQIFLLALTLEVFALTAPFYLQWVVDQVLVSGDRDLLAVLGAGFAVIAALSASITAARSWAVTWLGATINVQWASNLFGHLMRLPLDWYEKRHVGDIVSRFGSIQAIQKTLTTQFVGSLLDGIMSVVTLIVMGLYSLRLTLLIVGLFVLYGAIRWAFFGPLRRANEEQITYGARQQSELLESIRGAMTIKLANKQNERKARYMNATVATMNRDIGIQRLTLTFTLANQMVFGLGRIAVIWLAAILALGKAFSAGMLIAFIAYADQFIARAIGLVDKWVEFHMLKLHGQRIADIALTAPEPGSDIEWDEGVVEPCLEFCKVSFRYADDEPWILKDCSVRIEANECVAIVGPSGCGKTTFAKLALGLLTPTEGKVRFGGVDIHQQGLRHYRSQVSAVMQDDQLFAGSIAENISFFDPETTQDKISEAARLAAIHSDIIAMPMGYQSHVGDMGSALSGGQKQRLMLARALYQRPSLLVLDEATSHLDVDRERQISYAVSLMNMTRVIIAHRQETVASAQRIIRLDETAIGHACKPD